MSHHVRNGCLLGALLLMPLLVLGQAPGKKPSDMDGELLELLEKSRAKHNMPAMAAGIVRGGDKPRVAFVGVRKRDTEIQVTADDQWHLGSNSKPITALLIALLIELGLLDWDTPLERIFPEHAAKWGADVKKITPAHLLTHTSGLPALGPLKRFMDVRIPKTPAQDRAQLVKELAGVDSNAQPGEKYEYSNLGYALLGAIADRRGKSPWEEQVKKRIFQPLGIKHWGLGPPTGAKGERVPWPHYSDGKPILATGVIDNPLVMNSAGRVRISVGDYGKFLAEVLRLSRGEKGLLKAETAKKLFTHPYQASPHCLGGWIFLTNPASPKGLIVGHEGSNTLNYVTAVILRDDNFALCVLANQGGPGGSGGRACQEVRDAIRRRMK